jgi:hypothetical protein
MPPKSYQWRIEQLDRMAKMLNENNVAFQEAVSKDFRPRYKRRSLRVAAPLATIEFTKMQFKNWMKPVFREKWVPCLLKPGFINTLWNPHAQFI